MTPIETEICERLLADGLINSLDVKMTPFGGGVSSDVWRVDHGGEPFVVKRSLAKLKVAADWYADPARLSYEFRYLDTVSTLLPGVVPRLLNSNPDGGYLAMELLGDGYRNWKQDLLDGVGVPDIAAQAATALARIHNITRNDEAIRAQFDSLPFFTQLRVDSYLRATARKHPDLFAQIESEAERLSRSSECLVHGDYSPKNMMISDNRFVVLDCETAWYGDPAFDLAFLLNHLHLKALYHAPCDVGMAGSASAAIDAYFALCDADDADDLNVRTAKLLLILMLARVDGKSPVEYLNNQPAKQNFIRGFVTARMSEDPSLQQVSGQWFAALAQNLFV